MNKIEQEYAATPEQRRHESTRLANLAKVGDMVEWSDLFILLIR